MKYDAKTVKRNQYREKPGKNRPKLMTQPQAARELGVRLKTLKRLIADGTLVTIRVYARELIPSDEIDRFLAGATDRAARTGEFLITPGSRKRIKRR